MAFRVPFLIFLMQLTLHAHRSKPLTTRHRLCLCGGRVLRIQFTNDKESSFISCDQRCADENNKGRLLTGSRVRLRTRRELNKEQKACHRKAQSDPRWIINDLNVTFHDRENSSSWYARVSWNPFTDSSQRWKGYCLFYRDHTSNFFISSYVFKNLTSEKIYAWWEERTVYLAVVVLPMFANYSQNEIGIPFNPYGRRRPDPTLGPDVTPFTLKFPMEKSCQSMTQSDPRWIINDLNVTFHDRENSSAWYARVSWNPFTDSSQPWKGYCLMYGRHGSPFVITSYVLKKQTSVKISAWWEERKVYLAVVVLPMFANYSQNEIGILLNPYRRRRPDPTHGPDVTPSTVKFPTEKESSNTTAYVSISLGILASLALVFSFLVYFFRQRKRAIPLPSDFKYHAFIIYSYKDILWMKDKLLPFLEEKHLLTCCVDYRDFVPGKPFLDNMADSVSNSYKVVALFSNNSVNSIYFPYELGLAIDRLVEKRDQSLIVIRIDNVDSGRLPSELQRRTFVDYYDIHQRPFWKQRLLKFLDLPEVSRTNSRTEHQSCDNGIDRDFPGHEN